MQKKSNSSHLRNLIQLKTFVLETMDGILNNTKMFQCQQMTKKKVRKPFYHSFKSKAKLKSLVIV